MMSSDQPGNKSAKEWPIIGEMLPRRGNWLTQSISCTLLKLFGWSIVGEVANAPKMILIGGPHTSNWDFVLTIVTMFALGVRFSWVAKHTAFRWPVATILKWLGGVGVNRQNPEGFVDQMVEVFNHRSYFLLALMPEGTRSPVKQWRTGFYYIALHAQVPILMVIFDYGCKQLRLGPTLYPSGDITTDLQHLKSFYVGVKGKFPE